MGREEDEDWRTQCFSVWSWLAMHGAAASGRRRRGGAAVVVRHHTAVAVVVMENSKMYSPTASRTLVGQQSKRTVERMMNITFEIFI